MTTRDGRERPFLPRRVLGTLLHDDDWSQEFLDSLDAEYARRFPGRGVLGWLWYARQLLSPKTLVFVKLMRDRRKQRAVRDGKRRMGMGMLDGWLTDLTVALRTLGRERRFAFSGITTLALGIAGAATMFGVADRIFLRGPAHLDDPGALARVYLRFDEDQGSRTSAWMPWLTVQGIRGNATAFESMAAFRYEERPGRIGDRTRTFDVSPVGPDYFATLGTAPAVGRVFDVNDPADVATAVISHGLWQAEFGGDPIVIGQTFHLGRHEVAVVGVAPERFSGPSLNRVDVWVPADLTRAGSTNWWAVGRLRPDPGGDAGRTAAAAEADRIHRRTDPGRSFTWALDGRIVTAPLGYDEAGEEPAEATVARLLVAVVLLVLLIAGANVVNLILARMTRRRQEVAVRLAMGIGRWRLVRALVSESVIMALIAAVVALPLVHMGGSALRSLLLPDVAWTSSPLEPRVLGAMALLALGLGATVGALPALSARRVDVQSALRSGDRRGGGRASTRIHTLLATGQVTFAVTLMICAGLLLRSFWILQGTDLGLDADRVVAVELASIDPSELATNSPAAVVAYDRALTEVRADPRVESAALILGAPFIHGFSTSLFVAGLDSIPALPGGGPWLSAVGPDYFETAGTPILAGRGIESGDDGTPVVVVSRSMADLLWPGTEAIGACLRVGDPADDCHRVIGVAENVHRAGYREPPSMQFYVPYSRTLGFGGTAMVVRARAGVRDLAPHLEATLRGVAPGVELVSARTLGSFLAAEVRPWRMGTIALGLSAVLATLVAVLGVYGVLSYLVAQRHREIGVRLALGAPTGSVRALVLRSGMGAAVAGIVLGALLVLPAAPWIRPLLHQTTLADPVVLGTVVGTVLLVALAACLIPARQATRIAPSTCLRSD